MNMTSKKKFRKRDFAYFLVLYTLFFFMISYGFRSFIHRKERLIDIDEDGIRELIEPRGTPLFMDIFDEDGTIYTPDYNSQGILTSMLKEDPKKNGFTWDVETQRWFPDQNKCIWIPYRHDTQKKDVDADGIVEIVRRFECQFIDFCTITIIVDDDGTIIREEYVEQRLKRKVKMDIKGNLFMWDKRIQKWLPIQH